MRFRLAIAGVATAFFLAVNAGSAQRSASGDEARSAESDRAGESRAGESNGAYVFRAAGCAACHSGADEGDGAPLAGGRALETPFGTFYPPNITPDPEHGIGRWSKADFERALRQGVSPGGAPYYPAFPYTSYTGMSDEDVDALWNYLRAVEPSTRPDREHGLGFPFNQRWSLWGWRWLFFSPGRFEPRADRDPAWNRGAYLVRHVGHCGECHTPRSFFGAMKKGRFLQGAPEGPDGDPVPNIRADSDDGLGRWSRAEIVSYLKTGITPKGDFAGGAMKDVIEESTSRLSEADRAAIAVFLASPEPGG